MSGRTERGPSPSDHDAGAHTDVTDDTEFSSELLRLMETQQTEGLDQLEARVSQLLSDVRRARQRGDN